MKLMTTHLRLILENKIKSVAQTDFILPNETFFVRSLYKMQ